MNCEITHVVVGIRFLDCANDEGLIVFMVCEAGHAEDAGNVGRCDISAELCGEGPQESLRLRLVKPLDTPDDLMFAQDQCEELRQLIAHLNEQLTLQQEALATESCSGAVRTVCQRRIQLLRDQIRAENSILKTCKDGVIPTSGIPAPPPHLPFDLTPRDADDFDHSKSSLNPRWDYFNGIPRNPLWASQRYDNTLPNPSAQCAASIWSYHASDWAGCTTDKVWINQAKCGGGGHVNWRAVTYTGDIQWESHAWNDDDYNIRINRNDLALYGDDKAIYTTSNQDSVGMEFDSDETIDPFSEIHQWWHNFRSAVDSGSSNPLGINGRKAVVIGLLGMDYEHSSFTELHPLYALAINPEGDKWAFFVRNWGDEGYCSYGRTHWGLQKVSLLLENTEASNGVVTASAVFGTKGTDISAYFVPSQGEVVEVQLPDPHENGFVVGDLEIQWTPASGTKIGVRPVPKLMGEEATGPEAQIEKYFSNNATAREALTRAKTELVKTTKRPLAALTLQTRPATNSPKKMTSAPVVQMTGQSESRTRWNTAICRALGPERAKYPELCKK